MAGDKDLPSAAVKPRLRGVSHQVACCVALVAGALLVAGAPTGRAMAAAAIYAASLVALFGFSALYHRPTWSEAPRRWLRRLDHAGIFLLIGGTYTPICMLVLDRHLGTIMLWVAWIGTALGICKSLLWAHAPRGITVSLYLLVSWVAIVIFPQLAAALGLRGIALLLAGGVMYSVGALIYALRRPDPYPATFGYHEIFHALVIAASICHFLVIAQVTRMAS